LGIENYLTEDIPISDSGHGVVVVVVKEGSGDEVIFGSGVGVVTEGAGGGGVDGVEVEVV